MKPTVVQKKCIFCLIANQELPSHIIFEDQDFMAFLDHKPLFPGHCLLIPKQHFVTINDLPADVTAKIFSYVQKLSDVIKTVMHAQGTFIATNNIVSQSVPHFHIHIVPRTKGDGLKGFFWPRHSYQNEAEIIQVQKALTHYWKNYIL